MHPSEPTPSSAFAHPLSAPVLETPEWRRMYAADIMAVTPSRPEDPAWLFYTSGTTGLLIPAQAGRAGQSRRAVAGRAEREV
jgi:hypothetical protein